MAGFFTSLVSGVGSALSGGASGAPGMLSFGSSKTSTATGGNSNVTFGGSANKNTGIIVAVVAGVVALVALFLFAGRRR